LPKVHQPCGLFLNRIKKLQVIEEFISNLTQFKDLLIKEDYNAILKESVNRIKEILNGIYKKVVQQLKN
jgi:prephenate dehydrogenase